MKISCDIIRDLLPLYAENMTSSASNEMVEAHLEECESCSKYLDELRKPAKLPEQITAQNLNHIKKEIGKRRLFAVLTAVFLVLSVLAGIRAYQEADIILSADQAVNRVEPLEDGGFRVYWNYIARGWTSWEGGEDPGNWGMLVFVRRSDLKNTTKEINQKDMEDRPYLYYEDFPTEREGRSDSMQDNYWYLNWKDGTGDMLLWQGSAPIPAPDEVLGRSIDYNLLWCCLAAGILGAVFTLAAWLFRGRRAGKQIRYGALLVGGLCVSIAFASGGQFVSYSGEFGDKMEDAVRILIPMVLAGHFAFKLWDLNHPLPCVEYTREQQEKERRRKRHVYGALTIVLMMYSLAMFTYAALNVGTMYLTADEAIVSVEEQENGDVIIQYSDLFYASANLPARTMDSVEGTLCAGKVKDVLAYRLSKEKPEQTGRGGTMLYSRENMKNTPGVWYLNPKDGTADLKLVSGTVEKPEGPIVEKNHSFALYCALAGACTVLLMLLTRFLPGAGKYLRIGALISASLCLAALCIGGGSFYKFDSRASLGYRVGNSMNVAVPLFLTGLSAMKWKELKK